jgi:ADP-ribose pyrophosphatase YjhB (NUDIX family)
MYTIFSHDVPIYLTDNLKNETQNNFLRYDKNAISDVLIKTKFEEIDAVFLYHPDLKELWKKFKDYFKIERAAGGLIKNDKGETLFIFRLDRWDLPKGKIEKGESKKEAAIREVKEECGLHEVTIDIKLPKTYHIFERNDQDTLKITHWYLMKTKYTGKLTPQFEEDITEAIFKNSMGVEKALENTYGNINLLFDHLQKK